MFSYPYRYFPYDVIFLLLCLFLTLYLFFPYKLNYEFFPNLEFEFMLESEENHLDHMLGELKHEDEKRGKGMNFLKLQTAFCFNFYLSPHLFLPQ